MKTLLLLGLAALAFASRSIPNPRWIDELVTDRELAEAEFRDGREYRFIYNGQLSTGFPGASKQQAATRIQAIVSLVFKSPEQCLFKLTHIRMGKLNQAIPSPQKLVPFEACEEVVVEEQQRQQLQLPVQFKYNKGLIADIRLDSREQSWSANTKRAVLNMLQVNLQKHRRTDMNEEARLLNNVQDAQQPAKSKDFFTTMEETLEGDCETQYTVVPQYNKPECTQNAQSDECDQLKVTKSINFDKCQKRPEIKYNHRFQDQCPSCKDTYSNEQDFLRSTTVQEVYLRGSVDRFVIEKAFVNSQYTFVPVNKENNIIQTTVKQSLELVRSGPVQTEIETPQAPKEPRTQLMYSTAWDEMKEQFFMEGEQSFHEKTPFSQIGNKIQFTGQILKGLVQAMHQTVQEQAPRQFARLVKTLRMCKKQELEQIHEQIFVQQPQQFTPEEHKKVKDMLVDAVAICATKDCVEHLVRKTEQGQIRPGKAAWAIKALINCRTVSKHMVDQLLNLAKHQVCQRHPALKQSCLLTAGSMMNALCSKNDDQLAVEIHAKPQQQQRLCPRDLKKRFVQEMNEQFKSAENTYEKLLALKTIKNAGLDLSVFELDKIVQNRDSQAPHSPLIRVHAIDALTALKEQMPKKIQRILMPIYMNQRERPELRILSIYAILQTMPEKPILDQLAQRITRERNAHVASYAFSYLNAIANTTNPCEKKMAADLKLSLHQAGGWQMAQTMRLSRHVRMEWMDKRGRKGMTVSAAAIKSQHSSLPLAAGVNVHSNLLGSWQKYLGSVQLVQKNADQLLWQLIGSKGLMREQQMDQYLRRSPRSARKSPAQMIRDIQQKLSIEPREYNEDERNPFAMLSLRWKQQEYAMLPFSLENLPTEIAQMISQGGLDISELTNMLESGYHFNWHTGSFVTEISKKIPTSMGMPLRLSIKIPTVFSIHGKVEAQLEPSNGLPEKAKAVVKCQPSLVSTVVAKMECWSPVVNSGAKLIAQAKLHLPVDAQLAVDARQSPATAKLTFKAPTRQITLARFHSRPVTITRVWPSTTIQSWLEPEEKTVMSEEWQRVNTIDEQFGEKAFGLSFRVRGRVHHTPKMHTKQTPSYIMAGPNSLSVTCQPGHDAPQEVEIKMTGKMSEQLKDQIQKSGLGQFYEKTAQKFFGSEEQYYDDQDEQDYYSGEKVDKDNSEEQFSSYSSSYETRNPYKTFCRIEISDKKQRKCEVDTEIKCGQDKKHCQLKMQVLRTPIPGKESEPWKLTVEGESLFPQNVYQLSELTGKKVAAQLQCRWGPSSRQDQKIDIMIEGERSRQQERVDRQRRYRQMYDNEQIRSSQPELFSPVAQYDEIVRASRLTQYKIVADYKIDCPQLRNASAKLYRALKYRFYPNTQVNQVGGRGPRNQIRIKVNLDPVSYQTVNITAQLPNERVKMQDLPLPVAMVPVNMRKSQSIVSEIMPSFSRYQNTWSQMSQCKVQSRRVETFDRVVFRVPITTCYSVLAKDCSNEVAPKFAVLVKKISPNSEQKKLKILSEQHEITCEPRQGGSGGVKCQVNGQEIDLDEQPEFSSHQHVVLRVFRQGQYVKVVLPEAGVKCYFDGYTTKIKVSREMQRVQCGLCGDYNDEPEQEFRMANRQITDDLQQFHRSYLNQDSECELNEEVLGNAGQYKYDRMNWENEWEQDSWLGAEFNKKIQWRQQDQQDYDQYDSQEGQQWDESPLKSVLGRPVQQPTERTKVIENGAELCFSKRPVAVCRPHSFPIKIKKEQKIVYACLNRNEPDAERLQRRAQYQLLNVEVKDLPASFTETELVPELCQQM